MTEEMTAVSLVSSAVVAKPGMMHCCEDHRTPVVVVLVIVGEMMVQLVIPVTL